jgi:hypothetical protein
MKDIIRMNQLAGLITENQAQKMMGILNEGEYSDWWTEANNELGLDFEDDIYDYIDSDESWQRTFAKEVTNLKASDYETFKSQVQKLYDKLNPF